MKSLVIDPRMSGITGEMLMSALLDLTQDQECLPLLSKAICEVTHCTASVKAVKTDSNGIRAIKLDKEFNGEKFASPDDLERAFKNIANFMEISPIALEKGLDIIRTIGKSRKKFSPELLRRPEILKQQSKLRECSGCLNAMSISAEI